MSEDGGTTMVGALRELLNIGENPDKTSGEKEH
jgi:hypothetical protein